MCALVACVLCSFDGGGKGKDGVVLFAGGRFVPTQKERKKHTLSTVSRPDQTTPNHLIHAPAAATLRASFCE